MYLCLVLHNLVSILNFITLVCEYKVFIPFSPQDNEMNAKKSNPPVSARGWAVACPSSGSENLHNFLVLPASSWAAPPVPALCFTGALTAPECLHPCTLRRGQRAQILLWTWLKCPGTHIYPTDAVGVFIPRFVFQVLFSTSKFEMHFWIH